MVETGNINIVKQASTTELAESLLVRRQAMIVESGRPDPLTAYVEDPGVIPFVDVGRELLGRITKNAPELPVIVSFLTNADKIRDRRKDERPTNNERIIGVLLEQAINATTPRREMPPAATIWRAPADTDLSRSIFAKELRRIF